MAGTRTAPTVNGTPSYVDITLHMLDASGDFKVDTIRVPDTVIDSEIETYVTAYQLATNATIYRVSIQYTYNSVASVSNADNTPRASAFQVINTLAKDSAAVSQSAVIRAPEEAMFIAGTDQVNVAHATYTTYLSALLALLNGGVGGSGDYAGYSARYSERREINSRVLIP